MRKLYAKLMKVTVLWALMLVVMAIMAGASATVLASGSAHPLDVCSGLCSASNGCGCSGLCVCSGCSGAFGGSCKWPTN